MNPVDPSSAARRLDGRRLTSLASRRRFLCWSGCLGASVIVASCAPGENLPPLPNDRPPAYRLGAGDEIRLITVSGDQLSGNFSVDDSGNIALPLLGRIKAAGLTTSELETSIAHALNEKKLFLDPSVSVEVEKYRPIFILGEVNKPGEYPYQPGMTLLTAVTVAGGFTYRSITDYASVVRDDGNHAIEGKVTRQSMIQPGDVITIFERIF
jgi:polysaccharide export outer membrane protein